MTSRHMTSRTMKRKLLPRAVLVAILLALPAAADAPQDQYARFDGDSVTIMDTFTKLEWDRKGVGKFDYDGAAANCGFLMSLPSGRLPSVKELLTILDEEPHQEYEFGMLVPKMVDAQAFPDTPVDLPYWTSTPAGSAADTFWTLSFKTGLMTAQPKTAQGYARCVR
jgi:uncharacterized protein DUF1566